jgi:hypothetical protein
VPPRFMYANCLADLDKFTAQRTSVGTSPSRASRVRFVLVFVFNADVLRCVCCQRARDHVSSVTLVCCLLAAVQENVLFTSFVSKLDDKTTPFGRRSA